MKIKILGNGGAINDGLAYNSFIIDDSFLIEAPPDVMIGIFRENIDILKIKKIYISHFHADHYFGIPFLLLRCFMEESETDVKIIGPRGIESRVREICITAFGTDHPMQKWVEDYVVYEEIEEEKEIVTDSGYLLKPVPLFHSPETYGFILESGEKKIAYLADTYWEESLLEYIEDVNDVIVDLNGEKTDKVKVHISEDDLVTYALPNIKSGVRFYGTHLKKNKVSGNEKINYVKPGDEIVI
ncbi:MBL fold metallo-hydrolase [Thermodesulfobacteriota bacterium]